ncbi:MAG TPA: hypothetical protein VEA38_22090 [Terriglobales bacterium]|nr:hypothetical protein [Terriglobales bacterium]
MDRVLEGAALRAGTALEAARQTAELAREELAAIEAHMRALEQQIEPYCTALEALRGRADTLRYVLRTLDRLGPVEPK